MLGRLADIEAPPAVVRTMVNTFVAAYDVDMDEAEVPEGGYASFDAFFTRRLRAGSRPIAGDRATVVSPCDGRVAAAGPIDEGATFRVKGCLYDVGEMLGASADAARFEGGYFVVVYLAPSDYHRVHAPVSGPVSLVRHVPGTLYPVNAIGAHVPRLLARNERVTVVQRSAQHGEVATILVGAIGVGRVGLAFHDVMTNSGAAGGTTRFAEGGPSLERGDDLGAFHLGSTVVLFVGAGRSLLTGPGDRVKMGQPIAQGGKP